MSDPKTKETVSTATQVADVELRGIVEHFPGYVYSVTPQLQTNIVNNALKQALQQNFGICLTEGDSVLMFFEHASPGLTLKWKNIYDRAFEGEKLCFTEEFNLGKHTFWEFCLHPIFKEDKVHAVICYVQDVTEQKQNELRVKESEEKLRKSEARMRTIFDNTDTAYLMIDTDFTLLAFNHVASAFIEDTLQKKLAVGISATDYFPEARKDILLALFQKALIGINSKYEVCYLLKDGTERWYLSRLFGVLNEQHNIFGIAMTLTNITENKKAEEAIRISKEQYRILTDNPILGTAWGNLKGEVLYANKAYCELLECTLEDIKNVGFANFTHPDDLAVELPLFQKLVKGEIESYRVEKRYVTFRKNTRWIEINVSVLKDVNGKLQHVIAITQNITARKAAEQSLARSETNLRYILDSSEIAYLLIDIHFHILTLNKTADEWIATEMGIRLAEGDNFITHFPAKYKERAFEVIRKVLEGVPHSYEVKHTNSGGSHNWFHLQVSPITGNENTVIGICITARDITERKKSESEIITLNNSLEQKVKARTSELEEANRELEAFTFSVSHDLLAPLRVIGGFTDVLYEDYQTSLNEDGIHALKIIKRNTLLMGQLIDDLLNFSRLGRTPLVVETKDMNGLVNEVIDELRFTTNKLTASVSIGKLNPALCDPHLLKQVWINLLSNAVKYTRHNPKAIIEIGCFEKDNKTVYFIRDNGVGFDMRYVDKIFGVFQRLHKAPEFEGTGVGLAIVHRIIERHKGRIWAEAKVGEGATFYFTI